MDFRVDLDSFRGPLDLLLYLVRKHEVDITDMPIALVTEQYLKYLAIIEELDVNAVGEFLAVASSLIEIKSQLVLPRGDEVEDAIDDPREELVRRLLEYKEFRDAASILDEQSRNWQRHFARLGSDLPPRSRDLADEPIHEVELWDLVNAFGLIIRDTEASKPSNIVYDDTPIHVYMAKIHALVLERGHMPLVDIFEPDMHKSTLVGIFLAVLELVNYKHLLVEQNELFGEIWLLPRTDGATPLDLSAVDNYDHTGQTA
ncbi:MAG: segregation/condensation protein A [Pirellulales bacterium]|nr:segregation/condensation protein A [Pirellulales bacterium]